MLLRTEFTAYLPEFIVRELSRRPAGELIGASKRFEAITLVLDIAGFTPLSEALARQGKPGAEELTGIINRHFERLIDLVYAHGGMITRFAGDAMGLLFRYSRRNRADATRRAVTCAMEMQRAIGDHIIRTSAGDYELAMKIGISRGQVVWTIAGDPSTRLEYVVMGEAVRRCMAAEGAGNRGDVIVDERIAHDLQDQVELVALREGLYRVKSIAPLRSFRRRQSRPISSPPGVHVQDAALRFVHPRIAQQLVSGLPGFVNEHRNVTILFAGWHGPDADMSDSVVGHTLQAHIAAALRIVQRYDGHFARVDVDESSLRILVLFGAPVAHEDDEVRALRAALEIATLLPGAMHIGINTGYAFCANVGSTRRCEYTVMGDAVNLAERLMRAAQPGQIVVGDTTRRASGEGFAWQALGPVVVKGKADPVSAFALQGTATSSTTTKARSARSAAAPFVGRELELSQVAQALERASYGAGQVVAISGEAGMGKTRLATEVARLAIDRGFEVHIGSCDAYATNASYAVWQPIWRGLFGMDSALSAAEQAEHLRTRLAAIHPELAERSAMLGPVLGASLPEPKWIASLDPQQRADAVRFLLLECLRHWTSQRLLLLILEDCHWIDPLSHELLSFLANNAGNLRIAFVVLYRETADERDPMQGLSSCTHIRLTALDDAQSKQVLHEAWRSQCGGSNEDTPSAALLNAIVEKAQGNPLYIEGLVHFVCERRGGETAGILPKVGHSAFELGQESLREDEVALPDNLRSLILSRIDHLQSDEQAVLKVASVIGREFDASWLHGCLPSASLTTALPQHLAKLCRLDLLQPADGGEAKYAFRHGLIQETAYDSLAFANRSLLHERVGAFIEQRYANDLSQYFDVLAFHFGRTPNVAKQRIYFRKAADAAKAAYANAAAIDYYTRLLPLVDKADQVDVLVAWGGVLQLIGEWDEAEERFKQALAIADEVGEARLLAQCRRALGELYSRHRSYAEAIVWLEEARQAYERLGDDIGLGRTLRHLSFAYFEQGQRERARQLSAQHLAVATRANDSIGLSDALHNLGQVYAQEGDLDAAQAHFARALEVATQAHYKLRVIHIANDMARRHWERGEYSRAVSSLLQARDAAREIGYRSIVGLIASNIGMLYCEVGRFTEALECCAHALDVALTVGDAPAILACLDNLALIFCGEREDDLAQRVLIRAIALGRELNQPYLLCEPLYAMAHLRMRRGDYQAAATLNREALALATQVNDEELRLKSTLLDIHLRWLTGETTASDASGEFERWLSVASSDEARAAICYALWQLDSADTSIRHAAADLYAGLYDSAPKHEYRLRYAELTSVQLPESPALPSVPTEWIGSSNDLDALLARAGVT